MDRQHGQRAGIDGANGFAKTVKGFAPDIQVRLWDLSVRHSVSFPLGTGLPRPVDCIELGAQLEVLNYMPKVFIIDSNFPEDHFHDRADGVVTQYILKALGLRADLRLALDRKHFTAGVKRALKARCDVLHISTHGDADGVALCDDQLGSSTRQGFTWVDFVGLFQGEQNVPTALVLAACKGASRGLVEAFAQAEKRPMIIVGSSDDRYPADYVAAWALLYRQFQRSGITRDTAQSALDSICAVVHKKFRYYRWDDSRNCYLLYPGQNTCFDIVKRKRS